MSNMENQKEALVFGLDIGTRNIVGTVGYLTEDEKFVVVAQYIKQHESRAMLDGQIHDIGRVGRTISVVKAELEKQIKQPLTEVCIAAAGRVLKTVTTKVEYEYSEESVVTAEDLHTLDLLGIEKAHNILKEKNDTQYKFYCVGYSVMNYYLNDEIFISLEGHKAYKVGEDIIVTFLPEDVVDGLYSAVAIAGLTVANMTLEPIAAIDVAIPESYRMLNIALVDVGAGTSDISITRDGSIIAYGMIPFAGDELTEVIVQHYLVDFKTAEAIKLASTTQEEVTYQDIMSISHTIPASDVWELLAPVVEKITSEVASKILELNGDRSVSATFVVGGGGKVHGFTTELASLLDLPEERVALRGEEVLQEIEFVQDGIKKDPLLVTPIGICLNYYEQKNNFIMIHFNGERMKLYDNNRLTVVDAALQAGFPKEQLFPKRGVPINFTVNGTTRIARGEAGEPAIVTLNGEPANINTPLEPNCEIVITPSTAGDAAVYRIEQLEEYSKSTVAFIVNGQVVVCPRFVEVNGSLEPGFYEIKEGDAIEMRSYYTVGQLIEFMDVEVDMDRDILVNNRVADLDTLIYENFSIDWTVLAFATADISAKSRNNSTIGTAAVKTGQSEASAADAGAGADEQAGVSSVNAGTGAAGAFGQSSVSSAHAGALAGGQGSGNASGAGTVAGTAGSAQNSQLEPVSGTVSNKESQGTGSNKGADPQAASEKKPAPYVGKAITVEVNKENVVLTGKREYIFVDVFDKIGFDTSTGHGRAIVTKLNGHHARFSEDIHDGDRVEIYWEEN